VKPAGAPILITGVGRRVGLHLAHQFLARGRPVIGTFRSRHESLESLEAAGARLEACDFEREGDVERLIDAVRSDTPRLRAIIHNASDWLPERDDTPARTVFERMMRVHAGVPYELNLALRGALEAQAAAGEPADIIHIGDYVSGRGSRKHIAYAASKAAQDNLTLSFAALLAPGVKVNSIAPALVLFNEHDDAAYREKTLAKSLLRREGGLEEMQHQVDYLLDSTYVTGRIIAMDGGRHLA
jgi:dihydromonapterin reductase/dihydrofolate reductase